MNKKRSFKFLLILILGGWFLTTLIMASNPVLAESWMRSIARFYTSMIGPILDLIPFSMMELFFVSFYLYLAYFVISLVLNIFKKKYKWIVDATIHFFIVGLSVGALYMSTAGIAYQRLPVIVPQYEQPVEYTMYEPIVTSIIEDFNAVASLLSFSEEGSVINPYSMEALHAHIKEAFMILDDPYYSSFTPISKPLWSSWLYTEFHITGVHFGPSTESMFNALMPDALLPYTLAHEIVHAKGVMREDDANLVAMYIMLSSDLPYLRYSGYHATIYAMLNLMRYIGDDQGYRRAVSQLHPSILKDYSYGTSFWENFDLLNTFATWVNDTYLRLFGQADGVGSYVDQPIIEVIDDGETVIEVIKAFSPYQKLYFYFYFQS
jgi:hypothetical protein